MPADKPIAPQIEAIEKLLLKMVKTAPWSGMTIRQACMLLAAYRRPQTVRGLAETMQIDKPTLTRGADIMEGLGAMQRRDEPGNRRSVELVITETGERLVERLAGL